MPVSAARAVAVDDARAEDDSDDVLSLTVEPRGVKGLYGTLVGCLLGFVVGLVFPLESIMLPLIGWGVGSALPSSGPAKRRSLAVFIGTVVGTLAIVYLVGVGIPAPVLMMFPLFAAINAWYIERCIDRRKVLRPVCWQCRKRVKTGDRVRCVACGRIVHRAVCSIRHRDGRRFCRTCYAEQREQNEQESNGTDPDSSTDEGSNVQTREPEPDSTEENDSDEMHTLEASFTFGPAEEQIAVRLNRLFAACRSIRDSNHTGYMNARNQIDRLREELAATPIRMSMIENRVLELSGSTFHWDP